MNKLFLQFSTFYGYVWRNQFKNDYYSDFARKEWSKALEGFDEQLINQVIENCLKKRDMPPSLAQFLDCCKQLASQKKEPLEKPVYKPCNPIVAQTHLKKIKTLLNMQ